MNPDSGLQDLDLESQLAPVLDELTDKLNRGEQPDIAEYARAYPHLASLLRDMDPLLRLARRTKESGPVFQPLPDRLGDYRILRQIGRGGMGVVYEAVQESLSRRVALKVLPRQLVKDSVSLARFLQEGQAAARLHHTNIVPIFGVGEQEGVHYYAMQFIEGRGLDVFLHDVTNSRQATKAQTPQAGSEHEIQEARHGPDASDSPEDILVSPRSDSATAGKPYVRRVVRFGLQASEALAHAHSQGVLHRDIKPSNLLLDEQGNLWITDFGLAKILDGGDLTHTGDLVGTMRYLAPERFQGRSDERSDIYSLGLTLYELLTLRPAFDATNQDSLVRQITQTEPPSPRRLDAAIPRDLETIILKAIAKEPGRRYASAAILADDLRRFMDDRPIQARRVSAIERTWRWCRRNPALASSTIAALILLVVLSLVSSVAALWLRNGRDEANRRLFESLLVQAQAARWSGRVGQRFESLQALSEAVVIARNLKLDESRFRELRSESIACMALADVQFIKEWEGYPLGSEGLSFDGDLEQYARGDGQANVSVRRVADDVELAHLIGPATSVAQGLLFSPNRKFLAASYRSGIAGMPVQSALVWDIQGQKILFDSPGTVLGFSPDSRIVAVGEPEGTLVLYEIETVKEVRKWDLGSPPQSLAFHPDANQLAVALYDRREVQLLDLTSENLIRKLPQPSNVWSVAWQPTGVLLATACDDANVYLWDPATGRCQATLSGHQGSVTQVSFTRGGDAVLSQSWDGTARLWNPWTGRQLARIDGGESALSVDDLRLIVRNGTKLSLWDLALGREYRTLPRSLESNTDVHDGDISPDGRWLSTSHNAGVRVWDLATNELVASLPLGGRTIGAIFHPNGEELISSGSEGLYRWPFEQDANTLRIGPPRKLPIKGSLQRVRLDKAGRNLAVVGNGGLILNLENPSENVLPLDHPNAIFVSLSPDGRWAATGAWNRPGAKVWDTGTGQCVTDLLPNSNSVFVAFSPDSQRLVTSTGTEFCCWSVGSWKLIWRYPRHHSDEIPGKAVFTRDGKVLAVTDSPRTIQLLDPETGKPLVALQAPDSDITNLIGFNADGSQLVVATSGISRNQVWDLRRIRAQLAAMGLDWDLPPLAPPAENPTPLQVHVELGELKAIPPKQTAE